MKPLENAHGRLWMNLLSADDVMDITIHSYRGGSGFDSADFNINGVLPVEAERFSSQFRQPAKILVAAAGGGREMIFLARAGHQVTGFDPAPDLLEACRRNLAQSGVSGRVELSERNGVPGDLGEFDGLVIGRGAYHHIPLTAQRILFLRACREHLRSGAGIVLGEVMFAGGDRPPAADRAQSLPQAGDTLRECFGHCFTAAELIDEFTNAGFTDVLCHKTPDQALATVTARAG